MKELIVKVDDSGVYHIEGELVRCKNCMWYKIWELKNDGTEDKRYKASFCVLDNEHKSEDGYCVNGIREYECI